MSEPSTVAEEAQSVAPGVWWWHLWDDRIDFESDAYAVSGEGGTVLIDPLPLVPEAFDELGPVAAICLTAACHQRSAWRYREKFGVKVYAPEGTRPMEEEPDARYRAGALLPGGLEAVHCPGPEAAHYGFLLARAPGVFFCPDLVMRANKGPLDFVAAELHEDPRATRKSVRRLLDLEFSVLCLAHGAPIIEDPHAALKQVLERAPRP